MSDLVQAAAEVSPRTLGSYLRRWRMWQAFADHHRVSPFPADPLDVAAFVVARREAGVSREGTAGNLPAVAGFHGRSGAGWEM